MRAAGAGNELADAVRRGPAVGILRGEPLVHVIVAVQHDVDAELLQRPQRLALP